MVEECQIEQQLCEITCGDTIPFGFKFEDADGEPIDISGMTLFFTMKLNRNSADDLAGDLQDSVEFPANQDSIDGIGSMMVPALETATLIPDQEYSYDFKLVHGEIVNTLGYGNIKTIKSITQL